MEIYKRGEDELRNSLVIINGLTNNGNNVDSTVYSGYYYVENDEYDFYSDIPEFKENGKIGEWNN